MTQPGEVPEAWDWRRPKEHLARTFRRDLERLLPGSEWLSGDLLLFHHERTRVLIRHKESPNRFAVIILGNRPSDKLDFEGTYEEFAAREQRRYEIERRMRSASNRVPGICPVCSAPVVNGGCGGIWTGGIKAKASNGPLHHSTCKDCGVELISTPTNEEADAGFFVWEFDQWC